MICIQSKFEQFINSDLLEHYVPFMKNESSIYSNSRKFTLALSGSCLLLIMEVGDFKREIEIDKSKAKLISGNLAAMVQSVTTCDLQKLLSFKLSTQTRQTAASL